MNLSAGKIHEEHLQLVLHGVLGVLHNRFSQVWDPAMECLSFLIRNYRDDVWDKYVEYLAVVQNKALSHIDQLGKQDGAGSESLGMFYFSPSSSPPPPPPLSLVLYYLTPISLLSRLLVHTKTLSFYPNQTALSHLA